MIVTNYSSLRKDLKKYCDKVIDDWEAIIITRKNDKNVVLMSLIVWWKIFTSCQIRNTAINC